MFLSILVVFFTISFMSPAGSHGQTPTNEYYELQKKCAKQSEEWFRGKYTLGIKATHEGKTFNYYHYHHNMKLNKCFMIIGDVFLPDHGNRIVSKKNLFVINENKEYGAFAKVIQETNPISCYLGDKSCKTEKEWNLLVKPLMEE